MAQSKAESRLPIPDGLVVLSFDDGSLSNAEFVAPLLKTYGFGGTFFITDDPRFRTEHYATWEQISEMHDSGFEIGNHLHRHLDVRTLTGEEFSITLTKLEKRCEEYRIPRPVSFCYPGYQNSREAVHILEEEGYLFARRGVEPEYPRSDHGDRGPNWNMDDLKWAVEQAENGKIAVLTFHGVPDVDHPWVHTSQEDFTRYMDTLREQDCTVIALRDLETYVDPSVKPSDPYAPIQRRLK
jgi:peptidoglycan/xylan/chitin deacetylase (PgdA/CDA1 family)